MSIAHLIQSDAARIPLADKSVDLVFGSPPYCDARTYGIDAQRGCAEWVDWMLEVTAEACRVSRGLVLWVCAGVTRKHCYWPACEGLLWEWWKQGGQCWRPVFWHRIGIPGSGGKQWLRADVEYVLAFKGEAGPIPWADNTAMGHPPKWGPGGEMSHRLTNGERVSKWGRQGLGGRRRNGKPKSEESYRPTMNQWGNIGGGGGRNADGSPKRAGRPSHVMFHTKRLSDGSMEDRQYIPPVKANPGTLIRTKTGGGQMGSKLAHKNEAPFPEKLAEFFVRSFCPPEGIVFDPFSGSATTARVARRFGRNAIGADLRWNQCELGIERLNEPERVIRKRKVAASPDLMMEPCLFNLEAA